VHDEWMQEQAGAECERRAHRNAPREQASDDDPHSVSYHYQVALVLAAGFYSTLPCGNKESPVYPLFGLHHHHKWRFLTPWSHRCGKRQWQHRPRQLNNTEKSTEQPRSMQCAFGPAVGKPSATSKLYSTLSMTPNANAPAKSTTHRHGTAWQSCVNDLRATVSRGMKDLLMNEPYVASGVDESRITAQRGAANSPAVSFKVIVANSVESGS
jgi:hypothetical protein